MNQSGLMLLIWLLVEKLKNYNTFTTRMNYFKNNNIDKIIKDIKYAIKDIKSKRYKRKLLY